MSELRYTKDHEWVQVENGQGTVGITDYAQKQLGDVVYVELPEIGTSLSQGKESAVVESVKAASEIYAPVSGTVVAINADLPDNPALVNQAAQTDAWFFKIRLSDESELTGLMDGAAYAAYLAGLE